MIQNIGYDMPLDIEDQKLNQIKSFYNNSNHFKLFGSRAIFNNSNYRLVNVVGRKIISFIELKYIRSNSAIINLGIDINELNKQHNQIKLNQFIYSNSISFINQIKTEPSLQFIKTLYYSPHNSFLIFISNILITSGFTPITTKSEISLNKLVSDGIHSNYKLILRK
jgi:hypothetical protein